MKQPYLWRIAIPVLTIIALAAIWLVWANRNPDLAQPSVPPADGAAQVVRGAYLARAGNCMGCHTARGGAAFAGGRAVPTPFGSIYASNLTPDAATGIGNWSSDDFWRALHDGKSKDGRLLYPAFPYTNFTRVTRADADALFAYLQTLPAVAQPNTEAELRFPYNARVLLYAWRALYFRPGQYINDEKQSVAWNRGAYLTQGLGHCSTCHSPRDALGGISLKAELGGGLIPVLDWYAPPLNKDDVNGLGRWHADELVALLKTGVAPQRAVSGPMAEVVGGSLQYLTQEDVHAIAQYLQSLPPRMPAPAAVASTLRDDDRKALLAAGAKLYEKQCAGCHQASGTGVRSIYPALAGNRAVVAPLAGNAIRLVLYGGFAPGTAGNPRPYGMPPFGQSMSDDEVAAVVSYIRMAWGNQGNAVSALDVNRYRSRQGQ